MLQLNVERELLISKSGRLQGRGSSTRRKLLSLDNVRDLNTSLVRLLDTCLATYVDTSPSDVSRPCKKLIPISEMLSSRIFHSALSNLRILEIRAVRGLLIERLVGSNNHKKILEIVVMFASVVDSIYSSCECIRVDQIERCKNALNYSDSTNPVYRRRRGMVRGMVRYMTLSTISVNRTWRICRRKCWKHVMMSISL